MNISTLPRTPVAHKRPTKSSPSASDTLRGQLHEIKETGCALREIGNSPRLGLILTELDGVVVSAQISGTVNISALSGVVESIRGEGTR